MMNDFRFSNPEDNIHRIFVKKQENEIRKSSELFRKQK